MRLRNTLAPLVLAGFCGICLASPGKDLAERIDEYPHIAAVESSSGTVVDHEVGLGALQKIRGIWRFKDSERMSGELFRSTWQVIDGFSSAEVLAGMEAEIAEIDGAELLFSCGGRSCGSGSQWANRVFGQRILYGRDDLQQYRVYGLGQERWIIYASARTADRQYLHLDVLVLADDD